MNIGAILWLLAIILALGVLILHWAVDPWWGVLLLGLAGLGGIYIGNRNVP